MKLGPTDKRSPVNPFGALHEANTQPVGPGVAVPRAAPGVGRPESAKRVRAFAQALGDTPPRDGPFAAPAAPVALNFPPKRRVNQGRRKASGLDPYRNTPGGTPGSKSEDA